MKKETKENILRIGADIIHHKGYHHTGIQEILKAAGIPKGSFYFYFDSKEDFGLQVVDYFNGFFAAKADEVLGDASIGPLERIRLFLTGFIDVFAAFDFTKGCPIGNLAQEMSDLSPAFQKKLKHSFEMMTRLYAGVIAEAQAAGELGPDLEPEQAAEFIISSWHGALIRMKVEQNSRPMESHIEMVFNTVLRPVQAGN